MTLLFFYSNEIYGNEAMYELYLRYIIIFVNYVM